MWCPFPRKSVCLLPFLCCLTGALYAADPTPIQQEIQQLDAKIDETRLRERELSDRMTKTRRELTELKLQLHAFTKAIRETEQAALGLKNDVEKNQKAVAEAMQQQKLAMQAFEVARKELEEARKKFEAAEKQLEAARAAQTTAEKAKADGAAALNTKLPGLTTRLEGLQAQARTTEHSLAQVESRLQEDQTQIEAFHRQREGHHDKIQTLLEQAGEWISFRERIAPIFHERCLPCHNHRTSKGGYNMATHEALMSAGESGMAIVPGDAGNSPLYLLLADGSMPKDADPLTSEQLELIKQWINRGARLDRQVAASAPLIRIMPPRPQPLPPEVYPAPVSVTVLAIEPNRQLLASSGYHEVLVWSLADRRLVRRIPNFAERVHDLHFHPDGRRLVVAGGTPGLWGEVKVFDVQEGRLLADVLASDDTVFRARFSPDGTRLATAGADRSLHVFNVQTGQEELSIHDHADWIRDLDWSPDGLRIVTASRDKTAKVFDARGGKLLQTFNGHGESVALVTLLADGKTAVSAGADRRLRLWDIHTGKELRQIGGFGGDIQQLLRLADGQMLSLCADGKLRLHHTGDGKLLRELTVQGTWPASLVALPEPHHFAVGNLDGLIQFWDFEKQTPTASWTASPGFPPAESPE